MPVCDRSALKVFHKVSHSPRCYFLVIVVSFCTCFKRPYPSYPYLVTRKQKYTHQLVLCSLCEVACFEISAKSGKETVRREN